MNKKIKLVLASVILATLMVVLVYANMLWHMEISWTKENTTIGVYHEDKATPWVSPYNFNVSEYPTATTISFWIKNEGNVPVDVTNSTSSYVNCSATWNPTSLSNLLVDDADWLNLTLTITDDGHYNFDFNSIKHP